MEQAAMAGGPNPVDESGLCMLSFDGGGVRGLSSLYILDHIMRNLNHQRALSGQPAKKPCEIFNLIGGTSTGGLIAIMLGRLEMDVAECIAAYCKLSESVFKVKKHWSRVTARGKIQPRFDSEKLRAAIETVLKDRRMSPTTLFNDKVERGCKVFVCATSTHSTTTRRLRSYDTIKEPSSDATIVQVAMATSAASTFFDPVTIGDMRYIDGGLGANNPVDEVIGEARYILNHETDELKPLVKCFISIGTGNSGMKSINDNFLQFVSTTLVNISTNTELTAKRFALAWRDMSNDHRYFCFNVEQGLQDIDLSEYKESGRIKIATQEYLEQAERAAMVEECAKNLKTKQNRASRTLTEQIETYNTLKAQLLVSYPTSLPAGCQLPCHCLPFTRNKRFVGRETILENLSNVLFGEEPCDRVALAGLGGVGKTQTALQFAFRIQHEKPDYSVFWLSALSASSFQESCNTIAMELDLFQDGQDSKPILKRFLSSKKAGPWLIIVDNVDEMDLVFGGGNHAFRINEQLPNSSDGRILFTTRSNEVALAVSDSHVVEIGAMDRIEARTFLENSIVRKSALGDGSAVSELLEKLTYLPLAVAQAAAYLNRNLVTINRYLELLRGTEQDVASLLSRDFHDPTRYTESQNAVTTTWLVSFNQIVAQDSVAADLLRFISRIEAKAIPLSILPRGESMEQLTYSVGTLCAYTFLVPRDGQDIYDMHSLVHLATRFWVERSGLTNQTMTDAYKHLAKVFLKIQSPRHPDRREYMPHALRLLKSTRQVEIKERFLLSHRLGIWLECDGRLAEAILQHEQAFFWAIRHLAKDDPDRFKFEGAHTSTYRSYLQRIFSNEVFQDTLEEVFGLSPKRGEICEIKNEPSTFGYPNQSTGTMKTGVVHWLLFDDWEPKSWQIWITEAYQNRRQRSEGRKRVRERLGVGLEDTVAYWHRLPWQDHLGRLSRGQANKVAIEILETQVQELRKVLKLNDYALLMIHKRLANAYIDDGQFSKGIKLLRWVICTFGTIGSKGHVPIRSLLGDLAHAHEKAGDLAKSAKVLKHLSGMLSADFGEASSVVLQVSEWLARIHVKAGETGEALQLLESTVTMWKRIARKKHPARLTTEHYLGWVHYTLGNYDKAAELIQHVTEIRSKTRPEDDEKRVDAEELLQAIRNMTEKVGESGAT